MQEAGYDFIEFSGGTYEFFVMRHIKESTKKREAFYFEFAKQIKPAVKNAVVYLTGGLRTAPAMISAIKEGVTDGIGLGRPSTQEFGMIYYINMNLIFYFRSPKEDDFRECPIIPGLAL